MTASQLKRIRSKLARAAQLTAEAHELAQVGYGDSALRELTARATDDMAAAQRRLQAWDDRNHVHAEAILRQLSK